MMSAQSAVVSFSEALIAYYREYGIVNGQDGVEEGCCTVDELIRNFGLLGKPSSGRNPNGRVFVDFSRPVIDCWRQPYSVVYQATAMRGTNRVSVLVWSFGKNNINEVGRGDDIYSVRVVCFDDKRNYLSELNYQSYPSGISCSGRSR